MDTLDVQLPNGSDGDTLVLVRQPLLGRCLLFDAGDTRRLPTRDLLRVDHLFVSHCHVDHFIGFDALVRPRVCREDSLVAHGPPGFVDRVAARLAGYTWNLVEGNHFVVAAREIHDDVVRSARFDSGHGFVREDLPDEPREEIVHAEEAFSVRTAALDHHVVSQGWAVRGARRLSVDTAALAALGVPAGPWLADLKRAVVAGADRNAPFGPATGPLRTLGEHADRLLTEREGERVAFVTDTLFSDTTRGRIVELADAADVFACEAPFLDEDSDRALQTRHLTARQAGLLAGEAGVRKLLVFHVSERYGGRFDRHVEEALEASGGRVEVEIRAPAPVIEG